MNPIHDLSAITRLPLFDIFAVPPTQTTVERDIFYYYRPISTLDSKSTIEFVIENNFDEYVNLREFFLYIKVHFMLSKLDKKPVDDNDWSNINVSNYLLHSLFKHMDLKIGDKQINTSNTTYPYRSFLEALLLFDEESKNTYLQASGWYNSSDKRREKITPLKTSADKSIGKIVELEERLHLDLIFQDRDLLGGTTLRLKLVPYDTKFFPEAKDTNIVPQLKILAASWYVHKSKLNKEVVEAHAKALSIAPSKYPLARVEVKAYSIGKGSIDCSIENSIHGQLPRRLYICLVSNDAYNSSFTKDPFRFENIGVKYLCCYVDGYSIL